MQNTVIAAVIVTLRVLLETTQFNCGLLVALCVTFSTMFLTMLYGNYETTFGVGEVGSFQMLGQLQFWAVLVFCVVVGLLPSFVLKRSQRGIFRGCGGRVAY